MKGLNLKALEQLIEEGKQMEEMLEKVNQLKGNDMIGTLLIMNEVYEKCPSVAKHIEQEIPSVKLSKVMLDLAKKVAQSKGISLEEELRTSYNEFKDFKNKKQQVDETATVKNSKKDECSCDNQCGTKEEISMEEKVANLPDGCRFLIAYVYDDIKSQVYNRMDRCFMSLKPNRNGEICIYPDTILKIEKDIEIEKGYTNVKILNIQELD